MSTKRKGPFSVDRAEDSSGFLLWQVVSLWQRSISRRLAPLGISHAQFVLLAGLSWLRLNHSSVNQRALAAHVKMDTMTASGTLRRLEAMDLVLRKPDGADSRARDLHLTAKGRRVAAMAIKEVEALDKEFFKPLGEQLRAFMQGLEDLIGPNDPVAKA